jgi:ribosomal protein S18 acetylase RimI-like enzyme
MAATKATVTQLRPEHCEALVRFFATLPAGDLTFIKEDVTDAATVQSWAVSDAAGRWLAVEAGGSGSGSSGPGGEAGHEVTGYVAVHRLPGWSDHVGEMRLVVSPARRGTGLGRELARHALGQAVESGLSKLVVEVVAEQSAALALFTDLGFSGEALLEDHIRDRNGELRDLLVLAHHVGSTWSAMSSLGLAEVLDDEPG